MDVRQDDLAAHMPGMTETANGYMAPEAPEQIEDLGIPLDDLRDLTTKLAFIVPQFTTEWAAAELRLPVQIVEEILWQLKKDKLVEVLGQEGPFNYKYSMTQRGREHATRLMEVCGYVGPAPVSLAAYSSMLEWQNERREPITYEQVMSALGDLVLPESAFHVSALAAASGRSLFLFGPAGNGKTSVGRMIHRVMKGDLWIPHCISVGSNVIRLYDPQVHKPFQEDDKDIRSDRRWVRIERPLVVAGGEMTIDELDLAYSPALRFYEAPPHMKANGGTFLIDDFGRQRVAPSDLLNRWIIPLEHRVDHFTLITGQKIQLPFRLLLIVATNLTVSDVADPAFLRRMGYRLHLTQPNAEDFREIFRRYCAKVDLEISEELITKIVSRYQEENRDLRASEPRDLVERVRDICGLHNRPLSIDEDLVNLAWTGYFGNQ